MFGEHQQIVNQNPVPGGSVTTTTVLPSRFAQTSGEIVPTVSEQSTAQQMIYVPEQIVATAGVVEAPVSS
jgi:hypothetical protein